MSYKENYKKLLSQLKDLGADPKQLQSLSFYSLENEAKVRNLIKRLHPHPLTPSPKEMGNTQPSSEAPSPSERAGERISDYPIELHGVYLQKKEVFLKACSLKMRLNYLPDNDTEKALLLQKQIFDLFEKLDTLNAVLNHWDEHKRILKMTTEVDFSHLTPMQLLQKRNTLRSNVTARKKTLAKLLLPQTPPKEGCSLRIKDKIIKKQEEIKEMELQIEKLNTLIK